MKLKANTKYTQGETVKWNMKDIDRQEKYIRDTHKLIIKTKRTKPLAKTINIPAKSKHSKVVILMKTLQNMKNKITRTQIKDITCK